MQEIPEYGLSKEKLYLYSDSGSYEPLARLDDNHQLYWYHTTPNGTPERLTDETGEVRWQGVNNSWGKQVYQPMLRGGRVEQNLRMQGQYYDEESGLHYNLFRYYDPDSGRFTQLDPIGLAGGINLYQYAPNALGWVDPLGLSKCSFDEKPGPQLPEKIAGTFDKGIYKNRQLNKDEIFYKYHGVDNRTGRKISWLTNKKYSSEQLLQEKLAIRHDWGVEITKVSEFRVPRGTWVGEGLAAAQGAGYPGLGYQAVVSNLPKSWVIRTMKVPWL